MFKTEKYDFYFYKPKGLGREIQNVVLVEIATVERRDFEDEDIEELKDFFKDMGKWENFVKAGKNLLEELGIGTKAENEKEFGYEKYDVDFKTERGNRVLVRISLKNTESLRRTKGDTKIAILPIEEIEEQIKNVPKWQTLRKAISELKIGTENQGDDH